MPRQTNSKMWQSLQAAIVLLMLCCRVVQGRVYAPGEQKDESAEAIRKFNEFVAADDRVETVTLPIRDGVSIVQRRCRACISLELVEALYKSLCGAPCAHLKPCTWAAGSSGGTIDHVCGSGD